MRPGGSSRAMAAAAALLLLVACRLPTSATASPHPGSPTVAVASPSAGPTDAAPSAPHSATPDLELPAGFPVPPGASAAEPPANPPAIASWRVGSLAERPYDFYLDALPAAGYTIDSALPGGEAAIIRFHDAAGHEFQLDIMGAEPVHIHLGAPHP